jgi:hypothetical protein
MDEGRGVGCEISSPFVAIVTDFQTSGTALGREPAPNLTTNCPDFPSPMDQGPRGGS